MADKALLDAICTFAEAQGWNDVGRDLNSGRLSLQDNDRIHRLDIYIKSRTVGMTMKGQDTVWLKNVSQDRLKQIIIEPLNAI